MVERIIEYCANNKFIVFLLVFVFALAGIWAMMNVPLDAIPDLSDVQVIIYTEWPGRSPNLVEDQITYPIVSSMLAAPKVSVVRGISDFGYSYVYVIFEDGTDLYWARSRVLEYMSKFTGKLPEGVTPKLGPDATGVGWVFAYALVDRSGKRNLADLRSFNDWYLRYWIESVPGVAEAATVGGFVKQYQVNIDPNTLVAYRLPLSKIIEAIRRSNNDVGGRTVEFSGKEFMVRGRGYIRSVADIERIPVGSDGNGTPILLGRVANVQLGPDMRRGIAEFSGEGEVTGGIVVMRHGQNALDVIDRVKKKIEEVKGGFPEGVELVSTYDRSGLIHESIKTVKETLIEESVIVALVAVVFLTHLRSALVPIITLPIAVILSFIPMYFMGLTSNILSLGGIAVAIGEMIDASIVLVENAHKRLEDWEAGGRRGERSRVIIDAAKEVGKPLFFSLLVIAVSFLPIFTLEAQEGRLFKPLAFTKTFAMIFAALLSITLTAALMPLLIRGRLIAEERNPINRFLIALYKPLVVGALRLKYVVVALAVVAIVVTLPIYNKLGSEFMPPLNEGSILYMPITLPGISVTEATKYLQIQDKLIKTFPEVHTVFGKIGKSETSTDPAPMSMVETTVMLKPESEWRKVSQGRWYSGWATEFLKRPLRRLWPEERPMTWDQLIAEMDKTVRIPAFANAWLFPIRTRIDMITTGVRTPVGIKVLGKDLDTIEKIGVELESVMQSVPGTRSAFFERVTGGYYLDFEVDREAAARYDLTVSDVEDIIESAIGGKMITTTVEGRERYTVNVRYARELRDNLTMLSRVLVPTPMGAQVPIGQLARIELQTGPPMIKNEEGFLAGFLYVDVTGRDLGGYVEDAKKAVAGRVKLPPGYQLVWSGQYEYMERVKERLKLVVPLTVLIVIVLLYFNFGSLSETLVVVATIPFAVVGSIWFMYLLGYNMSIAVWVGILALLGVAAETGVIMLVYIDEAYKRRLRDGAMHSMRDLYEAIIEGAVRRLRPKVMTVATTVLGLAPMMWSAGAGADMMKRTAAPLIGGLFSATILTLIVIPAVYAIWKGAEVRRMQRQPS